VNKVNGDTIAYFTCNATNVQFPVTQGITGQVLQINDTTHPIGDVLTTTTWGNGQLPNVVDSLTGLTGQTYSATVNTAIAIKASTTIVSLTITLPAGVTGDAIEIGTKNTVTTLAWSGTGSTALPSLSLSVGQHITIRNTSGEWNFD